MWKKETNGVIWNIDLGAAYGTAKSGVGICSMGVLKPDLLIKSIVPIIMAGILGIYGLIVAVILNSKGKLYIALLNTLFFSRSKPDALHLRSRLQAPRIWPRMRPLFFGKCYQLVNIV